MRIIIIIIRKIAIKINNKLINNNNQNKQNMIKKMMRIKKNIYN